MTKLPFDGERVRAYFDAEAASLLQRYRQFEKLLPSANSAGASHRGEDGRFVESLLREYLADLLPKALEVGSGFVMRPAVKTGSRGEERRGQHDAHSKQLDIIVYDSANYPTFQRFAGNAVVPPESVVAIISVKKTLRKAEIGSECSALREAAKLCQCLDANRSKVRGPFLGLVGMTSEFSMNANVPEETFDQIRSCYASEVPSFDQLIGYVGALDEFSVFKARPNGERIASARYVSLSHHDGGHWALQFVLTGILSVFYDSTRNTRRRPGFSGFPPARPHEADLGTISVSGYR